MTPLEARTMQLVAELRRDWQAVLAHRGQASSVDPGEGAPQAALVALSLDHAYQAFESLLKRLEEALGLPRREGANWHSELLEAARLDLGDLRPPILTSDAARAWRELLKFRHFLRHAYTVELDATELIRNRGFLENAVDTTRQTLEEILEALASTE